jgi:hypothetical protein
VDGIHKLVELLLLVLREGPRLLVAAREVNVHIGRHGEGWGRERVVGARVLVCSCSGGLGVRLGWLAGYRRGGSRLS